MRKGVVVLFILNILCVIAGLLIFFWPNPLHLFYYFLYVNPIILIILGIFTIFYKNYKYITISAIISNVFAVSIICILCWKFNLTMGYLIIISILHLVISLILYQYNENSVTFFKLDIEYIITSTIFFVVPCVMSTIWGFGLIYPLILLLINIIILYLKSHNKYIISYILSIIYLFIELYLLLQLLLVI